MSDDQDIVPPLPMLVGRVDEASLDEIIAWLRHPYVGIGALALQASERLIRRVEHLEEQLGLVYDYITHGKLSKPYDFDGRMRAEIDDAMTDACQEYAREEHEWQPLETAPKSPTPEGRFQYVLFRGLSTGRSFSQSAVVDGWVSQDGKPNHCYSYKLRITHWMPKPEEPRKEAR